MRRRVRFLPRSASEPGRPAERRPARIRRFCGMSVNSLRVDGSDDVKMLCEWLERGAFEALELERVRPRSGHCRFTLFGTQH